MIVGLLHPGEMGAAVGDALAAAGHNVLWASDGRSAATRARAAAFVDAGAVLELAARSDVVFSVVPPHAARDVAAAVRPYGGIYVDANAVAPETARCVVEGICCARPRRTRVRAPNRSRSGAARGVAAARRRGECRTEGVALVGEMEEIANAFADEDLPPGFHEAAAEIYRAIGRPTVNGSVNDGGSSE